MKNLLVLFFLQCTIAIALGQITFTREWVTGKRSTIPIISSSPRHQNIKECSSKINLLPAIKYLLEIDNMLKQNCGPQSIPQSQVHLIQQSLIPSIHEAENQWSYNGHLPKDKEGAAGITGKIEDGDTPMYFEPSEMSVVEKSSHRNGGNRK